MAGRKQPLMPSPLLMSRPPKESASESRRVHGQKPARRPLASGGGVGLGKGEDRERLTLLLHLLLVVVLSRLLGLLSDLGRVRVARKQLLVEPVESRRVVHGVGPGLAF